MKKENALKFLLLPVISAALGYAGSRAGLDTKQAVVLSIFLLSIIGTLFFWELKLSFVFIGSAVLLMINAVDLHTFIRFASLDVILFLIAMMIIVGMMKEAGFFTWLLTLVLRIKNLSGLKLFILLMAASAVMSALMGEVASIVVMITVILDICLFLEVDPFPMIISSVFATNIGSASTVLGNPIGVLIAARSGLSFEDFLMSALPLSSFVLLVTIFVLCFWYRHYLRDLSEKLADHQQNVSFLYLITIPADRKTRISFVIFGVTIFMIGLHHRLEMFFGLQENTLLIMLPILSAGLVMLYRHEKARAYVEHEVEWNSLLFFMFLFAQAGIIQASGVADFIANGIVKMVGDNPVLLAVTMLFSTGFLSSALDNVVVVASYVPVLQSLQSLHISLKPLWWAMLFGACYGGNITMIGSTANIVALGLLEKRENVRIDFMSWLKVGFVVGSLGMAIAIAAILTLPLFGVR